MIEKKKVVLIVIIVLAIWIILKAKRWKPEIENMIKKEFNTAKKVFAVRDIIHDVVSDNPESNPSRKPKRHKSTTKTKAPANLETTKTSKGRVGPRRSGCKKSKNKKEEYCRSILEDYFDDYFPTARPNFLKNPKTGRPLELDGYNAALNLAFEYNGVQHYEYPNVFHNSEDEFLRQQERDKYKAERCKELGIDLITIPNNIPTIKLKKYILSHLPGRHKK